MQTEPPQPCGEFPRMTVTPEFVRHLENCPKCAAVLNYLARKFTEGTVIRALRKKLSRVVTLDEVREADYNLSPSLFVKTNDKVHHRTIKAILADLFTARAHRKQADEELDEILKKLGLASGVEKA